MQLDAECDIQKNPLAPKPEEPKEIKPVVEEGADEVEDEEMAEAEPAFVPSSPLAHLDLLLTYLWKVHDVDYYAGIAFILSLQLHRAVPPVAFTFTASAVLRAFAGEEFVADLLPEGTTKPEHRKLRGAKPEELEVEGKKGLRSISVPG